jgi:hypothetical protein
MPTTEARSNTVNGLGEKATTAAAGAAMAVMSREVRRMTTGRQSEVGPTASLPSVCNTAVTLSEQRGPAHFDLVSVCGPPTLDSDATELKSA